MRNGPVTKYWPREYFDEEIVKLTSLGFRVARFDIAAWNDEFAMGNALRNGLRLPSYTGAESRSARRLADRY
jgi:hypothetical protein